MGKFNGVLLATDYDDTLYNSSFAISPEDRLAIARFIAEGGLFTISTGRSYVNFAIQMQKEHLPVNVPVILSNGASIYDFAAEKVLWQKELPKQAAEHIQTVCAAFPQVGFEAYHGDDVYVYRPNSITEKHLTRCHLTGIPREIGEMPIPWLKVILQHEDGELLERVRDYILSAWPGEYEVTFSNPTLLEVTVRGANKGYAVRWLAKHLGIHQDHIYCVGNGINDIPMLEVSAVPFAPSNCYREVKEWGATILPSCDESCIAQLIGQLEKRYQPPRR